jgi:hypothetical protein
MVVRHGVLYRAAHQGVGKKRGTSQNGQLFDTSCFPPPFLQSKQLFVWNMGAKFGLHLLSRGFNKLPFAIKMERLAFLFSATL